MDNCTCELYGYCTPCRTVPIKEQRRPCHHTVDDWVHDPCPSCSDTDTGREWVIKKGEG